MSLPMCLRRVVPPALAVALMLSWGAPTVLAEVSTTELPGVQFPEPAASVAVANNGLMLAALYGPRQVAIVTADGEVSLADLDCSPGFVAVAPAGDRGWALCESNPHVYVIDTATGAIEAFDADIQLGTALAYVPATDQLVVGDLSGRVSVFSGHDAYEPLRRVSVPNSVLEMAISPDGTVAFAANDMGVVQRIDLRTGKRTALRLDTTTMFATSLAVSPDGATLYVAGSESGIPDVGVRESLLAVDSRTGASRWQVPFRIDKSGDYATPLDIVAGNRVVYVGSATRAWVGITTALFGIQIDADGRSGDADTFGYDNTTIAAIAGSANRGVLAVADTTGRLWSITVDDPPYPVDIAIKGSLKGRKIAITGTARGIASGTRVTVYVKNLDTPRARFVAQKAKATVGADGKVTWRGTTGALRVQVYLAAGAVKSPVIRLTRR